MNINPRAVDVMVGLLTIELLVRGSRSLKVKRAVLRRLKERIRNRCNVSISETAFQNDHQRSVVSIASVSEGPEQVDITLDRAEQEAIQVLGDDLIRAEREWL